MCRVLQDFLACCFCSLIKMGESYKYWQSSVLLFSQSWGSKQLWLWQLFSNEHALKEQVQHLPVVLIRVCSLPCTWTQQLSNNDLQVGIFPVVLLEGHSWLLFLLETGWIKTCFPIFPVSHPEWARLELWQELWRSFETSSL